MRKTRKIILIILCAALLLGAGSFITYRIWQYHKFQKQVLGQEFGIHYSVYYAKHNPEEIVPSISYNHSMIFYSITDDGVLYHGDHRDKGIPAGKLTKTTLTKHNFDDLIVNAEWMLGVDATHIRENSVSAWTCTDENDVYYYLILQKNGDLFLAFGSQTDGLIESIYLLNKLS